MINDIEFIGSMYLTDEDKKENERYLRALQFWATPITIFDFSLYSKYSEEMLNLHQKVFKSLYYQVEDSMKYSLEYCNGSTISQDLKENKILELNKLLAPQLFKIHIAIPNQKYWLIFKKENQLKESEHIEIKKCICEYKSERKLNIIKKYLVEMENKYYGFIQIKKNVEKNEMIVEKVVLTKDKDLALTLFKNNCRLKKEEELMIKLSEELNDVLIKSEKKFKV